MSFSSSMVHITLMCDKGTVDSILQVTSECQIVPWKRPAESVHKPQTGDSRISLRANVSRFRSPGRGCYISLGNELKFLVTRTKAKNKNAPGE